MGPEGAVEEAACFPDPAGSAQCTAGGGTAMTLVGVGALLGCAIAAVASALAPRFNKKGGRGASRGKEQPRQRV